MDVRRLPWAAAFRAAVLLGCAAVLLGCAPQESGTAEDATDELPEAAAAQDRAAVEEMLLGREREWVQGNLDSDPSVLQRILASDFIYTVPDGTVHDKNSFIQATMGITWTSIEIEEMVVRWYSDDLVVITGTDSSAGRLPDGTEFGGRAAWTNIFLRRDGEWKCMLGAATLIPPEA